MSLLTHSIAYNRICVNTTLTALKTHISIQKIHYPYKFMDDDDDDDDDDDSKKLCSSWRMEFEKTCY